MKNAIAFAVACVVLVGAVCSAGEIPAFPGAEGFGAAAVGGRGGRVIKVTNLNTSGPGSLQAACSAEGPRIVVFDVSGVIPGDVIIEHGQITIAGQTAPGGGITIGGRFMTLLARDRSIDDVIVRFVRVRPYPLKGESGDAIQFGKCNRAILDHVTCSWACDETIDIYETKDVTVQWSTIEESSTTDHPKGRHNFGLINGPDGGRVSIHHCLFAHHSRRCPAIAMGPADVRNNVVYDFRDGFLHDNPPNDGGYNIVGNYYKKGPSSAVIYPFCFQGQVSYYARDNFIDGVGLIEDPWAEADKAPGLKYYASFGRMAAAATAVPPVATQPAEEAYRLVLERAGCFPRDVVTKRTVREVEEGTGSWGRHDPGDLTEGLTPAAAPTDTDGDGMSDDWEKAHGLDPNDAADSAKVMESGYTAIEEYVNSLADALVSAAGAKG